jgi:hypothetical protein
MNLSQLQHTLSRVSYKDFSFIVGKLGEGFFIQVSFEDLNSDTKELSIIKGRKYYISPFMIEDEVFKTCFVAIEAALKHEMMENFKVDNIAPFHPHNNVLSLLNVDKVFRTEILPEKK